MISFAETNIGRKRTMNQDVVYARDLRLGNLDNLYLVCDGMGGEQAGDYASAQAKVYMANHVSQNELTDPCQILKEAIEEANNILYKEAKEDPGKAGMGTTIVAATFKENQMYVASVGDSRLYVAGKKKLTQITRDHSLLAELIRSGELTPEQAKKDERKSVITRAVGAEETVVSDSFVVELDGDETILICSDGLHGLVSDEAIYKEIKKGQAPKVCAKALVDMALAAGGNDNISAVIIKFN